MQYTTPTTIEELYATLKDIFHYYRIKRMQYEGIELLPFTLLRMEDQSLTDEEIIVKAKTLLGASWEKTVFDYKQNLTEKIESLKLKIEENNSASKAEAQSVLEYYSTLLEKYRSMHYKNGMEESGMYVDKLIKTDKEKAEKLDEIERNRKAFEEKLLAEIEAHMVAIENADSHFESLFSKQLETKIQELKDEREEYKKEVFKYNNSVNEKEVRYTNTVAQVSANLELKYIQIKANELSKDELIEMGYYEDVVNCVSDYFDRMPPADAYSELLSQRKLKIYLDGYYQDVMYRYKLRAES